MSVVNGVKLVRSVCLCVGLLASSLLAEPFDIQTKNLVKGLTLTISWMSSKVKVIGQRSGSLGLKT